MLLYILFPLLVQLALAHRCPLPFQLKPLDTNNGSEGCCNCGFRDTSYMDAKCGAKTPFMNLVEKLISARCDISDPCNRLGTEEVPNEWFDFIVVGGGVAGPIIARRLSDNYWWKVLLIEAGPEEPSMTAVPGLAFHTINSSLDWDYKTEPTEPHPTACLETNGVCTWPRGKMVSGTGGMHGMMYARGHPEVYNSWARGGATGWAYDEIVHYFERAEDPVDPTILSDKPRTVPVPGPMKIQYYKNRPVFADEVLKAASELGYRTSKLKEYTQTGFMVAPMTTENGIRETTSRNYLRPVKGRYNLQVLINAQVTKVLMNQWQRKALGVELVDKDGYRRIVKANKEVILTAGAIGSPHILMNSGIGPKEQLSKLGMNVVTDLPVGKNLHNHVSVGVHYTIKDTAYEPMTMNSVNEYLETRTGAMASTGLTQVTAFLESSYAPTGVPDIQMFFDGFSPNCPKTGLDFECLTGALDLCPDRRAIVIRPTTVTVASRGYMKLRSGDPLAPPLLYPNYFTNTKDLKVLIEGIQKSIDLTKTETMKKWDLRLNPVVPPLCANDHFGSDAFWECYVRVSTGPENHQAGTCKMGAIDDPSAVVDPELRVRGVPNVRVADASVFPTVPNGNPIAAIMMTAEKAADMIANTWK
ncbi:glucose dehydrogenase [FAD, quinone]-like [Ceratina calcarata]|uniref:Glucose dehydrogenase [FAD, quinone]-like n=1 Tax=Ceratina calcarata TaxID=156304 RepID=A0AAJ7SBV0_9HYME|nr:glucose dehydrogenase [FAD, quinone]-like [Ceratina calcarata]XP_026675085.1 glucose dehydrogenase [FAD, quinone]-like [Ceratina calcarata]XP_026675086.1 glucose dehydrogenase [FAD, quinone]-like [Ceratina calcarata]XP_026675087.1 glucose dehydrogenase [FAD, quinone]-like [Ceratina calcarata]XP_026675088.1 glucose dehydrogenase [FAD, quinone]-like [Ceratina calcarata]XP_026675089.1 glucose dehydrogenase [FAD, quinone]-like [Ceratina calcarata]